MLKKEYITLRQVKCKLENNKIIVIISQNDLNEIIKLAKNKKYNIKSIQINSELLNNNSKDIINNFKYISIIYSENIKHKISNQNNFIEIIVDFNLYLKNKENITSNSPNRLILDFTNSVVSKEILNNELNELIINKIFPITKGLPLDYTIPEHMYELYNKTLTIDEIKKNNLDNKTKEEIIKFLDNTKEKENEGFINRI